MLAAWRQGDMAARDQLFERLYIELRKVSALLLNREGPISLSTGDLVNEAVMRLIHLDQIDWQDKAHFMALSARMMRRVLIDHARSKNANKRRHQKVTLITGITDGQASQVNLLEIEEALIRLHAINAHHADIVEMRYFGGLSLEEIAEVMQLSPSTIARKWRAARAWLRTAMDETAKS